MKLKIHIWMKIILYIEDYTPYKLSFIIKSSPCNVYKNVKEMVKREIIIKQKINKTSTRYFLTKKGKVIKDSLINLNREIGFFNEL